MNISHVRKPAEFREILGDCGKIKESRLTVFFRRQGSPGNLSVGIIISKKTEPLATRRNYMRRVIYSVCGESQIKEKTAMIVRVDGKTKGVERKKLYADLRKNIGKALEKISK